MGKKQRTIHSLEELKDWIENNPSTETGLMDNRKIYISNYHEKIIVPIGLWKEAPVRPGGKFDKRMWRWGTEAPLPLYVHPDVMTSSYVFPITDREMASRLAKEGWVPLGELL